jgi:hypothetical protein
VNLAHIAEAEKLVNKDAIAMLEDRLCLGNPRYGYAQ